MRRLHVKEPQEAATKAQSLLPQLDTISQGVQCLFGDIVMRFGKKSTLLRQALGPLALYRTLYLS